MLTGAEEILAALSLGLSLSLPPTLSLFLSLRVCLIFSGAHERGGDAGQGEGKGGDGKRGDGKGGDGKGGDGKGGDGKRGDGKATER